MNKKTTQPEGFIWNFGSNGDRDIVTGKLKSNMVKSAKKKNMNKTPAQKKAKSPDRNENAYGLLNEEEVPVVPKESKSSIKKRKRLLKAEMKKLEDEERKAEDDEKEQMLATKKGKEAQAVEELQGGNICYGRVLDQLDHKATRAEGSYLHEIFNAQFIVDNGRHGKVYEPVQIYSYNKEDESSWLAMKAHKMLKNVPNVQSLKFPIYNLPTNDYLIVEKSDFMLRNFLSSLNGKKGAVHVFIDFMKQIAKGYADIHNEGFCKYFL